MGPGRIFKSIVIDMRIFHWNISIRNFFGAHHLVCGKRETEYATGGSYKNLSALLPLRKVCCLVSAHDTQSNADLLAKRPSPSPSLLNLALRRPWNASHLIHSRRPRALGPQKLSVSEA